MENALSFVNISYKTSQLAGYEIMSSSESKSIPSNEKCRVGSKLALENSERHYRCAVHLNEVDEFGVASSHLILSIEEAIKALFLCLKALGIPVRQKSLNDFLSKHKPRHKVGAGFYLMFSLTKWMFDSIQDAFEKVANKTDQEVTKARNEVYQKILNDLESAVKSDNLEIELNSILLPALKWWEKADERKKAGFYVDFLEGGWASPSLIKKEDYLQSLEIAQKVIRIIKEGLKFIESLSNEERLEIAKEVKKRYNKLRKEKYVKD